MTRYLIRKALQYCGLLLLITAAGFTLYHLAPNSPFSQLENPDASKEDAAALAEKWGLNDPLPIQYLKWLGSIARLDFGRSYFTHAPVAGLIAERVPATLELGGASLLLSLLIGIPLGIYTGVHRNSPFDQVVRVITVALNSVPHWWLGLMLIIALGTHLGWVPLGGIGAIDKPFDLWDRLWHLALPALVLATGGWLALSRIIRSETIDVFNQDYVRTARSKGLHEQFILYRHVLRNSLIPVITSFGGVLAGLVSGSALIEYTFTWPGMGRQTLEAAFARDYPIMLAMLLILSSLILVGYLISDLLYAVVDPRVSYD